jgi:hypothetical protein
MLAIRATSGENNLKGSRRRDGWKGVWWCEDGSMAGTWLIREETRAKAQAFSAEWLPFSERRRRRQETIRALSLGERVNIIPPPSSPLSLSPFSISSSTSHAYTTASPSSILALYSHHLIVLVLLTEWISDAFVCQVWHHRDSTSVRGSYMGIAFGNYSTALIPSQQHPQHNIT